MAEDDAELARRIVDELSRRAPTDVCFVLDDVHVIDDDDPAVAALGALIRELPMNAHVVLAGRRIPGLPLARLRAADHVLAIGADELTFTQAETDALATNHSADGALLATTGGWPAVTRLALATGYEQSLDYLMEEVVGDLDDALRAGLAATVLAHEVDDSLFMHLGLELTAAELMACVPLTSATDHQRVVAHDLWTSLLPRLVSSDKQRELGASISQWHVERGQHDEAIRVAAEVGDFEQARRALIATMQAGDAFLTAAKARQWLALFPEHSWSEPELLLLRGLLVRLEQGTVGGADLARQALEAFDERGQLEAEVATGWEVGIAASYRNDMETLLEMCRACTLPHHRHPSRHRRSRRGSRNHRPVSTSARRDRVDPGTETRMMFRRYQRRHEARAVG